MTGRYLITVCD